MCFLLLLFIGKIKEMCFLLLLFIGKIKETCCLLLVKRRNEESEISDIPTQ